MERCTIHVRGSGALGTTVVRRAGLHGAEVVTSDADVTVLATPVEGWREVTGPSVAAAVTQSDAAAGPTVRVAGFWGGLGSLLAAVAVAEAAGAQDVHVAYGFPGARRLLRRASPTLRRSLVDVATGTGVARVDGAVVDEPLGEGRRLAWFPRPVGPAHAVAVPGLEHRAGLGVPTVRTWVAARSLTAELLQAVGRWDPDRGAGAWLHRRAAAGGGGATDDVRWAVVAEVRDVDGQVVRAWANGTDPLVAAADLLLVGARRVAAGARSPDGTLAGLGDAQAQLDALADLRTLRWLVTRPEPSPR